MFRSTRGGARDRARERAGERSIFRSRPSESQRLREAREEMVTLKQDAIEYSREVVKCKNMYEELYEEQEKGCVK